MLRLAWFVIRAAFWLGVVSLFVPGLMQREVIDASRSDLVGERAASDTLAPLDRVPSWRRPQQRHSGN